MGNVQMEADQIRYKDSSGTYRNVQTGLAAAIAGGGGSGTLAGLTDTDITTPTNGQVLAYDSTESKWVNASGGAGATTLDGLTDTDISTPADGQVLTYDATAEKWENAAIPAQSIDDLSDTTITTPSDGQVLTYDATAEEWKNATPASGVTTLAALTDTDITTPSDGQVLTYDGTSSKWVNASGGSGGGEIYPLVETKIGTWGNDDLYRICVDTESGTLNVDLSAYIASADDVRSISGCVYCTHPSNSFITLSIGYYTASPGERAGASISQTSTARLLKGDAAVSNGNPQKWHVIVDYVKPVTP